MTLAKLAGIAGVSVSTASKAFSGSSEISEATREMIFSLAKEHGCFDKYYKNKYEKHVFAAIIPELNSEHYYNVVIAIQKRVEKLGGTLLISASNFSDEKTKELFRYYTEFCKVDGIIIMGKAEVIDNTENFPVVAIGGVGGRGVDVVKYSDGKAIDKAVELLVSLGHSRIAFAGEPLTLLKQERFVEALSKFGVYVREEYLQCSENLRFEQAGKECAKRLLQCKTPPTAIICAYDYVALGVMDELKEKGLMVPEDISVIGMDNINFTSMNGISLTSISYDAEKLSEMAINLLEKKMKNAFYSAETKRLPDEVLNLEGELVIRESIARAKTN